MKKIGSFFFTFIPFLLALVFQYLAMFFVMGVTLFYEHIRYIFSSNRIYADLWNKTLDLWSTTRVNTRHDTRSQMLRYREGKIQS